MDWLESSFDRLIRDYPEAFTVIHRKRIEKKFNMLVPDVGNDDEDSLAGKFNQIKGQFSITARIAFWAFKGAANKQIHGSLSYEKIKLNEKKFLKDYEAIDRALDELLVKKGYRIRPNTPYIPPETWAILSEPFEGGPDDVIPDDERDDHVGHTEVRRIESKQTSHVEHTQFRRIESKQTPWWEIKELHRIAAILLFIIAGSMFVSNFKSIIGSIFKKEMSEHSSDTPVIPSPRDLPVSYIDSAHFYSSFDQARADSFLFLAAEAGNAEAIAWKSSKAEYYYAQARLYKDRSDTLQEIQNIVLAALFGDARSINWCNENNIAYRDNPQIANSGNLAGYTEFEKKESSLTDTVTVEEQPEDGTFANLTNAGSIDASSSNEQNEASLIPSSLEERNRLIKEGYKFVINNDNGILSPTSVLRQDENHIYISITGLRRGTYINANDVLEETKDYIKIRMTSNNNVSVQGYVMISNVTKIE